MTLSVPRAQLTGTIVDVFGYGLYIPVFVKCISVQWTKYREGRASALYFIGVALTIFGLVTLHTICSIIRVFQAFTEHTERLNWPDTYYSDSSASLNIIKEASCIAASLVSDGLFVYRVFMVWGHNYYAALVPFMLFLADLAIAIWGLRALSQDGSDPLFNAAVDIGAQNFVIVTLVLNLLCTSLVSYKIWESTKHITGATFGRVKYRRVISILVESAALFSVSLVLLLVTTIVRSPLMFTFLTLMPPLIGVVFSTVIIRSSTGYGSTKAQSIGKLSFANVVTGTIGVTTQTEPSFPGAVRIQLEQVAHADQDVEILAKREPNHNCESFGRYDREYQMPAMISGS